MTRDELIRMAREAGFPPHIVAAGADRELLRFHALVAAAEREACAKLCDEQAERSEASMLKAKTIKARDIYSAAGQTAYWNAAAIRARGQA